MIQKEQILDRTFELMSLSGIKTLNMEKLASSLKISKKTIYDHFPNKKILVYESLIYGFSNLEQKLKRIARSMPNPLIALVFAAVENLKFCYSVDAKFVEDVKKGTSADDYLKQLKQDLDQIRDNFVIDGIKEGLILRTQTSESIKRAFEDNGSKLAELKKEKTFPSHLVFNLVIEILMEVSTSNGRATLVELKNNYS